MQFLQDQNTSEKSSCFSSLGWHGRPGWRLWPVLHGDTLQTEGQIPASGKEKKKRHRSMQKRGGNCKCRVGAFPTNVPKPCRVYSFNIRELHPKSAGQSLLPEAGVCQPSAALLKLSTDPKTRSSKKLASGVRRKKTPNRGQMATPLTKNKGEITIKLNGAA